MPRVKNGNRNAYPIQTSAPGRICLFGEHQDYLGLPVIASAIDLRMRVAGRPNDVGEFRIHLPDIDLRAAFDPNRELPYTHDRDYLPAAANVLRRLGLSWSTGYDVVVSGDIPINGGASSSSALQVAWSSFLLAAAGDDRCADRDFVARIAHQSEVLEFDSPGGMMDHFACSLGGVIWLDCRPPYRCEALPVPQGEFVLVDSGIPKDTNGVLGEKRRRLEGLGIDFLAADAEGDIPAAVDARIAPEDRPLLVATLANKRIAEEARELMARREDGHRLGQLLSRHHWHLSHNLGVSLPQIDDLLRGALLAGALGGKINGSGCGGSFFALCSDNAAAVREHFVRQGYRAWVVRTGPGLEVSGEVGVAATAP